ncbi:elymoclavine monooxygenase [Colletotrichum plurivorum]|uniref:Elymoclavine monooxygenase n=1 Tax=Colletotrichum plurivorum TaxID=2175906 RepID=A0A8H6JKL6_9PEZI|nr:elymoclavine monooxygenase [Colletotrichum plurivorum]
MVLTLTTNHGLLNYAPLILILGTVLCAVGLVVYRLVFHPLRKIPGPWYAAATFWYEFYQDVILEGNYVKHYPTLHAKYVYSNGTKYLKDSDFYTSGGGIKYSIVMLIDPEAHKQRRNTVKSLFSSTQMDQLAPIVLDTVKKAMARARRSFETGAPLDIQTLYQKITASHLQGLRQMNLVDSDDEHPPFLDNMAMFAGNFWIQKHFPIINSFAVTMPMSVAHKILPGYAQFRELCGAWIQEIEDKQTSGETTAADGRLTYFDLLLNTRNTKMYHRLSKEALIDEAFALCFAGTDTTSYALSFATYYLLRNPGKLRRMLDELEGVPRNADGLYEYRSICNLPYLIAVCKETLRMSTPTPGITPRRVPAGGAHVAGYYLPEGSTVSQSIRLMHDNPDLFPEPERFLPERWLGEAGWELEKCITYLEMYLCIANFFSHFDMSLHNTNEKTTAWKDFAAATIVKHVEVTVDSVK